MTAISYPLAEHTLANGLRVIVSEDHTVPNVAVNLWVGVGSRHEAPGRTGFAHLFEHLMFQGSRNVASGEHFSALMDEGARLNATTWFDRTNYFETVPTGALELALWLEADRHGHLLDAVTQENLDNQRDVVKEEKRQRYDNVPYGSALIDIYATAFPEDHPYHHPTIGSMEDLDAATLEDVHAFFRAHYGPNNTVLTLVGDVTPEEGFAAAETYFGRLPAIELEARERHPQLPPLSEPVRLDRVGDVPNDRIYVSFRLPVDTTPDYLACQVAVDVLGGLASSRLVRRLVRTDETAVAVGGWTMGLVDGVGLGTITVDVSAGADVEQVEAAVCEEIRRFIDEGPDAAELESVIADTERSWLSALASIEERADHISHHALLTGDPAYVNTFVDRIRAVTAEQARAAAAAWLDPASRAVVRYLADTSKDADQPDDADDTDRTDRTGQGLGGGRMTAVARPAVAPPEPWDFPEASTHDLPNGLRLITYDVPGQYVVSVRLGLPVSLRDEPREREGVASIMSRTLDEGTAQHTAEEFARLLERKGVSFGAGMADAGLSLDLDVVKGNLEPALDLLRQILTEPAFPADRGRPSGAHAPRRDRAGALGGRAPRRARVRPHVLRTRRPLVPAHGWHARDRLVDHPGGRGGLPRRARRRGRRDRRRRRGPRGAGRAGARRVGPRRMVPRPPRPGALPPARRRPRP